MKTSSTKLLVLFLIPFFFNVNAQRRNRSTQPQTVKYDTALYNKMAWRNIGPFRGGRSTTSTGVIGDPLTYYFGSTGGGVWKTTNAGISWKNVTDGFLNTGSVGAVAVSASDPNVVYAGTGEAPVRGVMTSSGDGVYRSTDAGKTWSHLGLEQSRHISQIRIHPQNPDVAYVSVQGSPYKPTKERGIYRTKDGGKTWEQVLFVSESAGASDLSMDMNNPRNLYAAFWDHQRLPWFARSGGDGSGIWKSTDGGDTWKELTEGLPDDVMGKIGVSVSGANSNRVYAIIEAEKGGLYRSDDGGSNWKLMNSDRIIRTRSWYYMHIFADPVNENVVYVMNAPAMKSIDGGKSFFRVQTPHGDNHYVWINPDNPKNLINSNDGGANITFDSGESWSTQKNQPTAQFYRVNTDNRFPYYVYGGQQDNSSVATPSQTFSSGISWKDWRSGVGGCESAYVAFDKDNPELMYAGCYQGIIQEYSWSLDRVKNIKAYPEMGLGEPSDEQKYRFNWNAPIIVSKHDPNVIYHAANKVLKSTNRGVKWEEASPDLTRNQKEKQGKGGGPITNEGAGGEIYNTLLSLAESPHDANVIWAGADDGLVHITRDGGANWQNVSPPGAGEGMVNSIEVSPHDPATVYLAFTKYKFNDFKPNIYKTTDYGATWTQVSSGIQKDSYVRVVREDPAKKGLLYAGTERGLYVSFDGGASWSEFQLNLPIVPITDLIIQNNDLVAATHGRAFWILDDLTPLHQLSDEIASSSAYLYAPRDYTKAIPSGMRRQGPFLGTNPFGGIEFKYYLKEVAEEDSIPLSIEILKGSEVIRTLSTEQEVEKNKIAKETGMNVAKWDLRTDDFEPAKGVMTDPRNGNVIRGYRVIPGNYSVKMTYGDFEQTHNFQILPDPREKVADNFYAEKGSMLLNISNDMKAIYNSMTQLQDVRGQIDGYLDRLGDDEDMEEVTEDGKEIKKKVGGVEERLISPKQETFQDVINFRNMLDGHLNYLMQLIDNNVPPITEGEKERFNDLDTDWNEVKKDVDQIINADLPAFNQMLRDREIQHIAPKKKKEEKVGS